MRLKYSIRRQYYIVLISSVVVLLLGVVLIWLGEPLEKLGFALSGAGASLLATVFIQILASDEQTELLRELSLSAEGVQPLPDEFRKLKWLAHATTTSTEEGVKCEWRVVNLEKIGDTGQKFAVYQLPAMTLVQEEAIYTCTFVGLKRSVVAIITLGDETTSIITFDTPVPAAGIYFGPAYITDWFGNRDLTLAIVGLGSKPTPEDWPAKFVEAFHQWHEKVNWNAEPLISKFDLSKNNTNQDS